MAGGRRAGALIIGLSLVMAFGGQGSAAGVPVAMNMAGYSQSVPLEAPIGGRFHVPRANCASVQRASMIVGVVLWDAGDGNRVDAGILVQCRNHVATYSPLIDIDGHRYTPDLTVLPGDRIVTIYSQNSVESVVEVRNHARHWTLKRVQNEETIDHSGAGAIADQCTADGCAPIPPFSTFHFFDTYINNGSLAAATRTDLLSHAGAPEAVAGRLTAVQQTRFGVRWLATCAPVAGTC